MPKYQDVEVSLAAMPGEYGLRPVITINSNLESPAITDIGRKILHMNTTLTDYSDIFAHSNSDVDATDIGKIYWQSDSNPSINGTIRYASIATQNGVDYLVFHGVDYNVLIYIPSNNLGVNAGWYYYDRSDDGTVGTNFSNALPVNNLTMYYFDSYVDCDILLADYIRDWFLDNSTVDDDWYVCANNYEPSENDGPGCERWVE